MRRCEHRRGVRRHYSLGHTPQAPAAKFPVTSYILCPKIQAFSYLILKIQKRGEERARVDQRVLRHLPSSHRIETQRLLLLAFLPVLTRKTCKGIVWPRIVVCLCFSLPLSKWENRGRLPASSHQWVMGGRSSPLIWVPIVLSVSFVFVVRFFHSLICFSIRLWEAAVTSACPVYRHGEGRYSLQKKKMVRCLVPFAVFFGCLRDLIVFFSANLAAAVSHIGCAA